ncbi:MAG: DNA-directed RNA polymerase subunit alpha [Candidatus Eisenbacteria bacterium]|uniref:DNA-directed RNA polymerase subunit alpha n=1 Tax=Eiseniibacteriota bacterium TaxID=2212470 RepID=A0A849SLZ0_UNCEI|nr:DNA-directed RNA polymerase subunit alpha [Candidatus Eisenbacteria bacterium]
MKWKNLTMPRQLAADPGNTDRYGKFTIEPLERGFGLTVGNSLRRVLLSSLQGAAITAVRIDGVLHEFSTLPGVIEDVTEIILNLKQVRLKLHGDGPKKAMFEATGKGEVRAGDLKIEGDAQVLNPDLHIATLNKDGDLRMEVELDGGRGYVSADQHSMTDRPIGVIPIDAMFSPVTKVNYTVEATRLGQRIDYDKLTIELWTDGSILPQDAVAVAAMVLRDHFSLFIHFEEPLETEVEEEVDEDKEKVRQLLGRSVDELELSVRSSNCLKAAEIKSISELVVKSEAEMLKFRNFGRKSLKEIQDILGEMGLHFGMDIAPYTENRNTVGLDA